MGNSHGQRLGGFCGPRLQKPYLLPDPENGKEDINKVRARPSQISHAPRAEAIMDFEGTNEAGE